MTGWVNGLAEWIEGQTAYLSIAFTWRLPDARARAIFHGACGLHVRAGGPALFTQRHFLDDVADVTGEFPDAIVRHHPQATIRKPRVPGGLLVLYRAENGRASVHASTRFPGAPDPLRQQS